MHSLVQLSYIKNFVSFTVLEFLNLGVWECSSSYFVFLTIVLILSLSLVFLLYISFLFEDPCLNSFKPSRFI